ncbi:hypothetical protein DOY81_006861 [Sarcophaga bullata]|nr:hypothetical protein DOY81_006861 [Sarcophaga bullata]
MRVFKIGDVVDIKAHGAVQNVASTMASLMPSRRVKENERLLKEAKAKGTWVSLKRQPVQPKKAHFVKKIEEPIVLAPIPYKFIA